MINALCKKILSNKVTPTKIWKDTNNGYRINLSYKNPLGVETLVYETEKQRDADYEILEKKVFGKLSFNPYVNT